MELGFLLVILQLVFLEGILSIDNAAVLGAMVAHLPVKEPIPWPRLLRFLQQPSHRFLGGQRMAALKVGLLGAYLGRGTMLALASFVVENAWLRLLGALYLIKLAAENLGTSPYLAYRGEALQAAAAEPQSAQRGFWQVVLNVELADLAFSFDNVVAAVALSGELWVVLLGVFLGIITMRFAASVFTRLMDREPILEPAAYILVFNIGTELVLEEFLGWDFSNVAKFLVSITTIVLCVAYAHVPLLQRTGLHFVWLKHVLGAVDAVFALALKPVVLVVKSVTALVRLQSRAAQAWRGKG